MKKMLCLILALVLLCGCQSTNVDPKEPRPEGNTENHGTEKETQDPGVTVPENEQQITGGNTVHDGCVRVEYTGNISAVCYITSADQLPDHEALAGYDAAYFENKALVLVKETVTSGSVKVGIASIEDGVVTLSHELSGQFGTTDMATWMLWAEVEAGLEYDWSVANPALKLETHTH